MPKNTNNLMKSIDCLLEGLRIDGDKVTFDPAARKQADALLHKHSLTEAAGIWNNLEAQGDSLSHLSDEINFETNNTDSSAVRGRRADPAVGAVGKKPAAMPQPADLGSQFPVESFDFDSIFKGTKLTENVVMNDEGEEVHGNHESDDIHDGDDNFSELQLGMDQDGMGGEDANGVDSSHDEIGGDDTIGDDGDSDIESISGEKSDGDLSEPLDGDMDGETGHDPLDLDGGSSEDDDVLRLDDDHFDLGDLGSKKESAFEAEDKDEDEDKDKKDKDKKDKKDKDEETKNEKDE